MMKMLSPEFFMAVLFIIDLCIIFLLVLFVKRVNRIRMNGDGQMDTESITNAALDASSLAASDAAKSVNEMLAPLVEASREAALDFDQLIREKKKDFKEFKRCVGFKNHQP